MAYLSVHSPLGPLTLQEDEGALSAVNWGWSTESSETGLLALARDQLDEYFHGDRRAFELPLAPDGSPFQRAVWRRMLDIPYGETASYGIVADDLDSGPRAVGMACARNPLPIFIPCHRVVGADGSLTGYSGGDGLQSKRYLLTLETGSVPG